jgi:hypothetical protein
MVKNAKCERISIVHQAGKRRQDARRAKSYGQQKLKKNNQIGNVLSLNQLQEFLHSK